MLADTVASHDKTELFQPVKPGQPFPCLLLLPIPIRPLNPCAETINVFAFTMMDVLSRRLNVNGQNMQFSRYIFAQLLRTTCAVTLVIIGIVWLFQTIRLLEMVISRGAAFSDFILMSFAVIPLWLTIALPIGAFVAVNWVFHRILNDRELTVMQAIGLSPMQIARAPIALGALVSAAMLANSIFILPSSFGVYKEQQFKIRNSIPAIFLQDNVFVDVVDGMTMLIEGMEAMVSPATFSFTTPGMKAKSSLFLLRLDSS